MVVAVTLVTLLIGSMSPDSPHRPVELFPRPAALATPTPGLRLAQAYGEELPEQCLAGRRGPRLLVGAAAALAVGAGLLWYTTSAPPPAHSDDGLDSPLFPLFALGYYLVGGGATMGVMGLIFTIHDTHPCAPADGGRT